MSSELVMVAVVAVGIGYSYIHIYNGLQAHIGRIAILSGIPSGTVEILLI
jgi:hypothetical protein